MIKINNISQHKLYIINLNIFYMFFLLNMKFLL